MSTQYKNTGINSFLGNVIKKTEQKIPGFNSTHDKYNLLYFCCWLNWLIIVTGKEAVYKTKENGAKRNMKQGRTNKKTDHIKYGHPKI